MTDAMQFVLDRFPDARIVPDGYGSMDFGWVLCGYAVVAGGYDRDIGYGATEDSAWSAARDQLSLGLPRLIGTPILVWRFDDAPVCLQELSPHGGDEDWVAFIPEQYADEYIGWLEHGSFGVCDISRHPVLGGEVRIGAHA